MKSASFILLQGVPAGISLQEVEYAVKDVEGVKEVHELHIWQLSESKVVASLHIHTSPDHDFMQVATEIRKRLHDRGIHSVTIQPEYHRSRSSSVSTMDSRPVSTFVFHFGDDDDVGMRRECSNDEFSLIGDACDGLFDSMPARPEGL